MSKGDNPEGKEAALALAELAHELRQPLTGIRATAELLLEAHARDPRVAARVQTIVQQVERIQRIIDRFRRAGAPPPEAMRADLNQAVDVAWSLLEGDAERQGTVLHRDLAVSLPAVAAEPYCARMDVLSQPCRSFSAIASRRRTSTS